jgi:hypothetical protein
MGVYMAPPKSLAICQRLKRAGCLRGRPALDIEEVICSDGAVGGLVTAVLKVTCLGRPRGERLGMGGEGEGERKGLRR